jgi:threonine dehydrogenase-like Zn-dependent dehydrogenase
MRAAVTTAREVMEVVEVRDPREPDAGEVLVRPEAVGICGSDFHYFLGNLGGDDSQLYPRVQGHEFSAVVEQVGPECPKHVRCGDRVAVWPVASCGQCYPCRIGRSNVCVHLSLVGIHRDGALQERLRVPATQVFPVADLDPALAALVEPVSIAMRAVVRGRVARGEKAVVFGAGPIGQSIAAATLDRGASVLLVDPVPSRLEIGRAIGAEALSVKESEDPVAAAREWAGGDGPEVVFEATGVPDVARTAVELVAQAGRVVVVGLSHHDAPLRVGDLAFKEIDVLGVSCCQSDEFAEAVSLVTRRQAALASLVTHEFSFEQAPEAIRFAIDNPSEVMKAIVHVGSD